MRFLIDTCVVSEWKRRRPATAVISWLDALEQTDIAFSILTVGELRKGILRLPESRRRDELTAWFEEWRDEYERCILPLSHREVEAWAAISAAAERGGRPLTAIDGLIAGTAIAHGLIVATRNVDDFLPAGATVYDPWTNNWYKRQQADAQPADEPRSTGPSQDLK